MSIGNIVLTETGGKAANGVNTAANPEGVVAPNQSYRLVNLDKLVSTKYQRTTSDTHVDEITADFNENRLDPLCVAVIDGKCHLIDGLHRSRAMKRMGYTHAYARVLTGLSYEQAAGIFRRQNEGRRPVGTLAEFNAGLEEKDPACMEIARIVDKNGFRICQSSNSFYNIESVKALVLITEVYGFEVLNDTLGTLSSAWAGVRKASYSEVILGAAEFVKRYGKCEFAERLKDKFIAIHYDYKRAVAEASIAGANNKDFARRTFAKLCVEYYNKGLHSKSKKRLVWEVNA